MRGLSVIYFRGDSPAHPYGQTKHPTMFSRKVFHPSLRKPFANIQPDSKPLSIIVEFRTITSAGLAPASRKLAFFLHDLTKAMEISYAAYVWNFCQTCTVTCFNSWLAEPKLVRENRFQRKLSHRCTPLHLPHKKYSHDLLFIIIIISLIEIYFTIIFIMIFVIITRIVMSTLFILNYTFRLSVIE